MSIPWEQVELFTSDGAAGDNLALGYGKQGGIAIYDNFMIAGAIADDYDGKNNAGSAYIFKKDDGAETWTEVAKLTSSDIDASDYLGTSTAIYGDCAVVGSYTENNNGAAYILKKEIVMVYGKRLEN